MDEIRTISKLIDDKNTAISRLESKTREYRADIRKLQSDLESLYDEEAELSRRI